MFSVLGDREIGGRTGTILQGESGANDPVGIALMIGMIELADASRRQRLDRRARVLCRRWRSGSRVGVAGGLAARRLAQARSRSRAPVSTPCARSPAPASIYGIAAVAGGSGFLAVFVAGLLVGDVRAPFKAESEVFHDALSSLAEIVVFVALGLTISISALGGDGGSTGSLLAAAARVRDPAGRRRGRCCCRAGCATASARSSPGAGSRARSRSCSPRSRSGTASPTPTGSTTSSSSSCSRRSSSRARRCRSPPGASACRCAASSRRRTPSAAAPSSCP